jgi:catechol 2,3-dioxygenase-like lactoylglutathione lyase family enzyme
MPVRSLLHYALDVPDQTRGQRYYMDFGLRDATGGSDAVRLRPGAVGRDQVLLYGGSRKRLHHLAFAAPGVEYSIVRRSLAAYGARETDPPSGGPDGGIWVRDPDGHAVNVRDETPPVSAPDPPLQINSPGHAPRKLTRGVPPPDFVPAPRRLGHVLLFTPDMDRQIDFYTRALGLKLSDRSGTIVAFLRCTTDHHNLAFLTSERPGFHHGSFEVGGLDEIAMGARHMQERGWEPFWGLGRHVIGSNFFYYIRDPWGSFTEYFFDLDYIPEDAPWEPHDWDAKDALYRWGPECPAAFGVNVEDG